LTTVGGIVSTKKRSKLLTFQELCNLPNNTLVILEKTDAQGRIITFDLSLKLATKVNYFDEQEVTIAHTTPFENKHSWQLPSNVTSPAPGAVWIITEDRYDVADSLNTWKCYLPEVGG
jgi:hypothetical protein